MVTTSYQLQSTSLKINFNYFINVIHYVIYLRKNVKVRLLLIAELAMLFTHTGCLKTAPAQKLLVRV